MKSKYKIGDKVIINYDEVAKSYENTIEESKLYNKGFSENLARQIFFNELKEMQEYDKNNGVIRNVKSISFRDALGKKIARYTLDNEFVYYESELKEGE